MKSKMENRKNILDDTLLRSLIGDDEDNILLIYLAFLESSQEILKEISLALAEQDLKNVLNAVHKLKSAALSVGANDVGACAMNIESLIHKDSSFQEISIAARLLNEKYLLVEDLIRS